MESIKWIQSLLLLIALVAPLHSIAAEATAVSVALPDRQTLRQTAKALGVIESESSPAIAAEISGRITNITVEEGVAVNTGQLLVELDDEQQRLEVGASEAQLRRLQVLTDNQKRKYARLQSLAKTKAVSTEILQDAAAQLRSYESEIDVANQNLALARLQLARTRISSPLSGRVAARHRSVGDYVNPSSPLVDLIATNKLRARLHLPERHAALVKNGQSVELFSPATKQKAHGTVTAMNPMVAGASRVVAVLVSFSNSDGWLPGASVDASIVLSERNSALVIPKLSLAARRDRQVVYVVANGFAQERVVEIGWREGQWVEVLSGLDEAERVVVDGAFLISDGTPVTVVGSSTQ